MRHREEKMGFELELSGTEDFVPMHYTILRARKGEAFPLGCQNFQTIKTSRMLVPVRDRGAEDDPEAPVVQLFFYSTGAILWVKDFQQVSYSSHLYLTSLDLRHDVSYGRRNSEATP